MNNCTFAGRLGGDAETRFTQDGKAVTGFSLAVDERAGKGERKTTWVKCSMWGERGEKVAPYLKKGAPVSVSGQVGINQWTASNGETKADLTLFVHGLTLLGSRDAGSQSEQPRRPQPRQPAPEQLPPADDFDDDIPF